MFSSKKTKKKNNGPVETWVKISKVMPQTPHFPREREESLMAKSLSPSAKNKTWLDRTQLGSLSLKLQTEISFSNNFLVQITVNHADFMHFAHNPHELHEIRYKIHPH